MVNPKEVQQYLSWIDYPTTKEEIIKHATDQGADEDVLDALQNLDDDMVYESFADVSVSLTETE